MEIAANGFSFLFHKTDPYDRSCRPFLYLECEDDPETRRDLPGIRRTHAQDGRLSSGLKGTSLQKMEKKDDRG